jgi:rhomboid protease GluP
LESSSLVVILAEICYIQGLQTYRTGGKHTIIGNLSILLEVGVEKSYLAARQTASTARTLLSYQAALYKCQTLHGLAHIPWVTWLIVTGSLALWGFTASQVALASGAYHVYDMLMSIASNALNIQDKDTNALATVLITYGAKENVLIQRGQYWRFVTPIFLHVNMLHIVLNMLNLLVLGIFLERLLGHLRFLLIFLVTGIISVIASFYFAPLEISVGASGAIFGLVGAYSIFVLVHRRALCYGGIPSILWLTFVIGINLGAGFFSQAIDNYAHIGGLLSGSLLGWWFMPIYRVSGASPTPDLADMHSLSRRWPLALLTILGTLLLAMIALYLIETKILL